MLNTIVSAKWPPKVNAADTAKAEFSTTPYLFIFSIELKVVALVTSVERKEKADNESTPIFLPIFSKGLLSNLETTNIRGKAPDSVTQALAQMNAAFSKLSKYLHISIFVIKVNIAQARPSIAIHLMI